LDRSTRLLFEVRSRKIASETTSPSPSILF
jgi:hypothetical protein